MFPLSIVLLFATAAPQQSSFQRADVGTLPQMAAQHGDTVLVRKLDAQNFDDKTCFTMRSYHFRRQDGQAPVLASTTTCTPANKLQQRKVSPGGPGTMYVPMGLRIDSK